MVITKCISHMVIFVAHTYTYHFFPSNHKGSEGFLDYGRNISGISRQELGPSFP